MSTVENTKLKTCALPENRGLSQTDRAGWSPPKKVSIDDGSGLCHGHPSDHYEEQMHLLQDIAARTYPARWGNNFGSEMGKLAWGLNGGVCGYGTYGNYSKPIDHGPDFKCQYTYHSESCAEDCIVAEAWYYSMKAYYGMCYYYGAADRPEVY